MIHARRSNFMKQTIVILSCLLLVISLLAGCGAGNQKSDLPDHIKLISPLNGASDVNPKNAVIIVFAVDILESSINSSTFRVTGPTGNVTGTVEYNPVTRSATFKPDRQFVLVTPYTVHISGLQKAGQENIENMKNQERGIPAFSYSFTTRDGSWGTPEKISGD
jgi:hypothetical protein